MGNTAKERTTQQTYMLPFSLITKNVQFSVPFTEHAGKLYKGDVGYICESTYRRICQGYLSIYSLLDFLLIQICIKHTKPKLNVSLKIEHFYLSFMASLWKNIPIWYCIYQIDYFVIFMILILCLFLPFQLYLVIQNYPTNSAVCRI